MLSCIKKLTDNTLGFFGLKDGRMLNLSANRLKDLYKQILISAILFSLGKSNILAQQQIRGIITGIDGLPLQGVTVAVKGISNGTLTDAEGHFNLTAKTGNVLVFSFIGYKSREITIRKDTVLKLSISISALNLDETVVTGYTSQKVKEIAGSI